MYINKKKLKLQVGGKFRRKGLPKWVPPENRMWMYDESVTSDKQKQIKFKIIVPDQETKEQLQAAFEFIHDNMIVDYDFIAIDSLGHAYLDDENEVGCKSSIIVDPLRFQLFEQMCCKHKNTYTDKGITWCKDCGHDVIVTSYRD